MSGVNIEIKQDVTKKIRKFIDRNTGELKDGGAENLGNDVGGLRGAETPPKFN